MAVKPWQVVLVVGFFLGVLGTALWITDQKLEAYGASRIHSDEGRVSVLIGTRLVRFRNNEHVETIPLEELGMPAVVGGIDFFPDGDLLVHSRTQPRSLSERITHWFGSSGQEAAAQAPSRLLRCDLDRRTCSRSSIDRTFPQTFRPLILPDSSVIISDTNNHQLLWFDKSGTLTDQFGEGLRFPNGLALDGETPLVANTNENTLTRLSLDFEDGQFSRKEAPRQWDISESYAGEHVFPTEVSVVGNQVWTLISDPRLSYGRLVRLDGQGQFKEEVEKPKGADLIDFALHQGGFLASDFSGNAIYRFSETGEFLGEWNQPELSAILRKNRKTLARLDHYLYATVGVGVAVFVALFAFAAWQQKKHVDNQTDSTAEGKAEFVAQKATKPLTLKDPDIHWLQKTAMAKRFELGIRWGLWSVPLLAAVMVGTLAWDPDAGITAKEGELLAVVFMPVILCVIAGLMLMRTLKVELGVKGQWLIAADGQGEMRCREGADSLYTPQHLWLGDWFIPLRGRGGVHGQSYSVFEESDLKEHLFPLLEAESRKIGELEHTKRFFKVGHPFAYWGLGLCFMLVAMLVYLELA